MSGHWKAVPLGEVVRLTIDAVPVNELPVFPMAGIYSFGRGLFARGDLSNAQTTYRAFHRLHKDMFVISSPKAWEGALARVPEQFDGWFLSPVFPTFVADPGRLDVKYLEWFCRQAPVWDELRRRSRGMGARRESVSPEQFLSLEIPLPPLAEQRHIVARVEAVAARIGEAQRLRKYAHGATATLLRSILNSVFAKSSNPRTPLGELCHTTSGGTPSRSRIDFYEGNIPWVKSGELEDDVILRTQEYITEAAVKSSSAKVFPKGTLVVALYGATVGKTGVLGLDAATNQAVCALFPKAELHRDYLWWFLRSKRPDFLSSSFGGAQPNISQRVIRDTEIPLAPLDEQLRIVAQLDRVRAQVGALNALQDEVKNELDAFLPSVLDKALKGEF